MPIKPDGLFTDNWLLSFLFKNILYVSCVIVNVNYNIDKNKRLRQGMVIRDKKQDIEQSDESDDGQLIGYARVSTKQQNLETQIFFLLEAGVEDDDIYREKMSGRADKRPQLDKALRRVRRGDTFVVYKLDRLGRSLSDLINKLNEFRKMGVHFKSITEGIDIDLSSCTPAQRLQVNMIASLAQFEVDLDIERTTDGVRRAMARGVKFGATEKITDEQVKEAMLMIDRGTSKVQTAKHFKVSPQTIYRRIRLYEKQQKDKKESK